MEHPQLPPRIIAGADQELASASESLDQLLTVWRHAQPLFDREGFDHLTRVALFAVQYARATPYPAAVLAVAVERLARQ